MSVLLQLAPIQRYSATDRLALEALLSAGRDAELAFRQWLDSVDFERMSGRSTQLLPLLFTRFFEGRSDLIHYPRARGLHRQAHVRNGLLLASASEAARQLVKAGMPVMLMKGSALALRHYPRPGLRPMGDIDLLVRAADFAGAAKILESHGWRYRYRQALRDKVTHSCDYINAIGHALDLHSRALLEINDPEFEEGLFARAEAFDWNGLGVMVPSAEDEALICLVSAMREPEDVKFLWLTDLACLMAAHRALDWGAVWRRALQYNLGRDVFHTLQLAASLRGNEVFVGILTRLLSETPEFETDYLTATLACGSAYGLSERNRSEVDRTLSQTIRERDPAPAPTWARLTETPSGFGTIDVFTTEGNEIKALHLRWRHLPLIPALFDVKDDEKWRELCRQSPQSGAGTLDIRPGLLEWKAKRSRSRASYRASVEVVSDLPDSLPRLTEIPVQLRVYNGSAEPWPANVSGEAITSFMAFRLESHGLRFRRQGDRALLRAPIVKEGSLSFLEPGAGTLCELTFTAPAKPGSYQIRFDLNLGRFIWQPLRALSGKGGRGRCWRLEVT